MVPFAVELSELTTRWELSELLQQGVGRCLRPLKENYLSYSKKLAELITKARAIETPLLYASSTCAMRDPSPAAILPTAMRQSKFIMYSH